MIYCRYGHYKCYKKDHVVTVEKYRNSKYKRKELTPEQQEIYERNVKSALHITED